MTVSEATVIEALRPVRDPDVGLSLVDLGLVYGVEVLEDGKRVLVRMTLTSPACPIAPQILAQVRRAAESVEGVEQAEVELVWSPPWDPATMATDEVKDILGIW
ncbi:MAG TPA: metal-sulfur cluster assembly factor [Firmicutes bacterium]|nr:metal-sulfur cluster assembly factor [Bacillota bacterium]